jgi:hypothetical protein
MRWVMLVLFVCLVGCGSENDAENGAGDDTVPFSTAQEILDGVASRHANLKRLTLHAVPTDEAACMQIASTMAARRGKPSDPEDLDALRTGNEVILDEPDAIDVTVPILVADGKPTAVAGVTLALKAGDDRDVRVKEARAIAQELEKEIRAASKPLW